MKKGYLFPNIILIFYYIVVVCNTLKKNNVFKGYTFLGYVEKKNNIENSLNQQLKCKRALWNL